MRHWWLVVLACLEFAACTPRGPAQRGPAARAPRQARPAAEQPKRELTLTPGKTASPAAPALPAPPPLPVEQTLPALPSPPLLPADFELGPLADRLGADRQEREALNAAERFLSGLATAKVPEEELLPERRQELALSLQYYLDQGLVPSSHRLGALEAGEDEARIELRLFGSEGACVGEAYLSRAEGRWYLSDLQAGFPLLAQPYTRRQEKYIPSEVQ